jgi:outer membrane protein TolC
LPTINLVGTSSYQKDAANASQVQFGGDPYNAYKTDLKLTQPLFQYGSLSAINSVKKARDMSKYDAEAVTRDTSNSVIQAYYQVVINIRNVDTLLRQQRIVRESLATSQHRERTGRGQLLDVLQTRTQVALLDAQITDAQNQVAVAATTLANLLGDTEAKEFHVSGDLNVPSLKEVDRNLNLKEARVPEIERNQIAIAQIDDQKDAALGTNLPVLSAIADYTFTSNKKSDLFEGTSAGWNLGLQLTIPIFSGLSSIYQRRGFESQRTQLEYERVNLKNQFTMNEVNNRKKLESAYSSILSGQEALKLAIASSNEANRNYRYETIDFLQFLTVQQAYVTAEQSLNGYKYTYLVALGNYFVASGQNIDRLVELLEGVYK